MYCPQCGNQNTDSAAFCKECGASLLPVEEKQGVDQASFKAAVGASKKKSIKRIPTIVLIALIMLLVSGVAYAAYCVVTQVVIPYQQEVYKAEQRGKYHIETDYYSFDIPEYWWGKVGWRTETGLEENDTVVVFPLGHENVNLMEVSLVVVDPRIELGGSVVQHTVVRKQGSKGYAVSLWHRNWPFWCWARANDPQWGGAHLEDSNSDEIKNIDEEKLLFEVLVDLQTGGKMTSSMAASSQPDMPCCSFAEEAIVPTINPK